LKGLHQDWQLLENPVDNTINFNNLPPGKYQLALKAALGTYPDSATVYSSEFFIKKPFYFRGWFILLSILFLIALGYVISTLIRQTKDKGILRNSLNEKIIEIALREDRFRIVWNNSQDGLILSVLGGKVIAANPTICEMANVSEDELRNNGLKFLFDKTDFYETVRNDVVKELQSDDTTTILREMVMPLKSGNREIEVLISKMKESYEGKVLFLNVFRDISRKKAYEKGLKIARDKAEEVSQLKSNIISNMSHEIRTPLNGILGGAEYVMQIRPHDKELLENLDIIKESGERLLSTTTNFLDLALLEANELDMVFEETNINDFISKLLINHKSVGIKKGILVTSKFLTKPFVAEIERRYLEIIINKIVGNSVKYTEKGIIEIFVENNNNHLEIKVRDQGIGMSKAYLDKLFYPFEQESNGFNRKFEGSGLGLTITKHLVEKLKGQISIESKKGNGTTVKISLPLFT
jgi:PAS domain S-box-containing protein